MRMVDPGLELVACGSSGSGMPTFGSWERDVLRERYELVDHISCHAYYGDDDGDVASFLASAVDMDHFIDSVVATADHVGAELKSSKRIVVVGNLLISLLRHSDRVALACLAQLANVIAPIMTEPAGPAWRQPTFHPFAITSRLAAGQVLRVRADSPLLDTARFGEVPSVDAVATYDEETGKLAVFLVNPLGGRSDRGHAGHQPYAGHRRTGGTRRTRSGSASREPVHPMKPVRRARCPAVNLDREASGRAAGPRARPVSDR
jgi:alpha-N-arabinofuranosidase